MLASANMFLQGASQCQHLVSASVQNLVQPAAECAVFPALAPPACGSGVRKGNDVGGATQGVVARLAEAWLAELPSLWSGISAIHFVVL
jgi:hypothetical protein